MNIKSRIIPAKPRSEELLYRYRYGGSSASTGGGGVSSSGINTPTYWELITEDSEGNPIEEPYILTKYSAVSEKEIAAYGLSEGDEEPLPTTGVTTLKELSDTIINNPINGNILIYNGTHWENKPQSELTVGGTGGDIDLTPYALITYVDNKVKTDVPIEAKFTDTIYTHPSSHPASMITETADKRFVTDVEKGVWNDANSKKHTHSNKALLDLITQSNIDVLAKLSIVDGNIKVDTTLWATGGISALGFGEGGGGSGGGGVDMLDSWINYTTVKANYYVPASLLVPFRTNALDRLTALESGSATSIKTTGTGNAITSITKSGTEITASKGSSFALSTHSHTIANVTGLQTALDGKQATLTQGSNITITGSTISAVNTTYGAATTSANGLMSSADKSKLNDIASNANNYSLPTASGTVLGGIKVGSRLSINSGSLSANVQSDNNFTTALKNKLDGIEAEANKTTLSSSTSSTSTTNAATSSAVRLAYNRGSTGITNASTAQARADSAYTLASGKENSFTKNTAFNKNFGTVAGTVVQGNDSRLHTHSNTAYLNNIDQNLSKASNVQFNDVALQGILDTNKSLISFVDRFNDMFEIKNGVIQAKYSLYTIGELSAFTASSGGLSSIKLMGDLNANNFDISGVKNINAKTLTGLANLSLTTKITVPTVSSTNGTFTNKVEANEVKIGKFTLKEDTSGRLGFYVNNVQKSYIDTNGNYIKL